MTEDDSRRGNPRAERLRDEEDIFADHVAHPRGGGALASPIATVSRTRPVCGDAVTLAVGVRHEGAEAAARCEVRGNASGCAVHRAATSLLCEVMEGRTLAECEERLAAFRQMMASGAAEDKRAREVTILNDAAILASLRHFPARLSCVMTSWEAFGDCLTEIRRVRGGKKQGQ